MKKLLLLLMAASFGIAGTATAQKKSKKNHDNRNDKSYGKKYDRHHEDRDDRNWNYNSNNNNAPRKVRDAFNRDYPNASNVNWTKDRSVWTANFKKSGLFGGRNSVSYKANGQRVSDNNNGIFGRDNDRTARSDSRRNDNNRRNW